MNHPSWYAGDAPRLQGRAGVADQDLPLARQHHEKCFVSVAMPFVGGTLGNAYEPRFHDLEGLEGELFDLEADGQPWIRMGVVDLCNPSTGTPGAGSCSRMIDSSGG